MSPIADGDFWTRASRRARDLSRDGGPTAQLLDFYSDLLAAQKTLFDGLRASPLTGRLAADADRILPSSRELIAGIQHLAPEELAAEGRRLLEDSGGLRDSLLDYWREPSDRRFFPKAILQAYAQALAAAGLTVIDRERSGGNGLRCPFCDGPPQLSILESGRRHQCAICLTIWPAHRVRCAHCGDEDERKLGYFRADELAHIRVDTCDACGHYVKTIDLGALGTAVPLADEIAGAPLDAWARERGYEKAQLNLLGF